MPSQLRNVYSPITTPVSSIGKSSPLSPQKKAKMSITQTYYLAHTARGKLAKEASRSDHDLRTLVGHANLLDSLMLDLADAEQEQESWFNQTVKGAAKASEEPKHIQWADSIREEIEEDEESEDSDDEYEIEEEQLSVAQPLRVAPTVITTSELATDMEVDDEEDDEDLALARTSSRSPPELLHEADSDSEDESMPASPPYTEVTFDAYSEKQSEAIATSSYYNEKSQSPADSFYEEGFYLPQRQQATVISAY
ncbi:hypothetical protein MMC09_004428 [Bachmanniomyces sp. S44760]|nr:hypothetical protein [Bachmanniomyces sp. S44760]